MLAEKNAEMGKAVTIIKRLSGSARERRIAEIEELARMDAEANLRGAYNSGEAQGIEKGMEKGIDIGYERAKAEERAEKLKFAVSLLQEGVPLEVVSRSSGISVDELRKHSAGDVHP
jgi:predicted transposase/invertase (TIGR01784 family)